MWKKRFIKSVRVFLLLFLLSLLLFFSISSLKSKSITTDEIAYQVASKRIIKEFKWDYKDNNYTILHPPLTYYLHGLSFYPFSIKKNFGPIFYARLMMQTILLLFSLTIFFAAKKIYGIKSAFFALFLFVFNHEILAHGRLITADLTLAFFIFAYLISFYYFLKKQSKINTLLSGFSLGLALLTKYNSLLLVIFSLLIFIYYFVFIKKSVNLKLIGKFFCINLIGIFLINL